MSKSAHHMRQAQCHRKPGRALDGKAKTDNCAWRHSGGDGQIGPSNEDIMVIDHLDKMNVG
jgi:hypothetical protein